MFYAALRVLCVASLVAEASAVGFTNHAFANRAALKAAVDNCLAANSTGGCDCSSASVDCGVAGNLPISQWDTSFITDMNHLFYTRISFDANISAWNTAKVTKMDSMFAEASAFNQDIGNWNTSSWRQWKLCSATLSPLTNP